MPGTMACHPRAATEAGVSHHHTTTPGRRRTRGGLDHRQLPPPADRPPHGEGALHLRDERHPVSLAHSRLLQEHLLKEYAATRVRRAINLKSVPHNMITFGRSLCSPTPSR
jgi:hypothetical protein